MCQVGSRLGPRLRMMGKHTLSSENALQLDFLEEPFQIIARGTNLIKSGWHLSLETAANLFLDLVDLGFDMYPCSCTPPTAMPSIYTLDHPSTPQIQTQVFDPDILICDGSWNSTPARKQASKSSQANTSHLNSLEVGKARHKAISFSQSQIAWKNNLRKTQLWAPHSLCWLPTMSKWRLGFQHWAGNEQAAWGRCLRLDTLPVWCGKLLLKGQETTQGTEVYVNCPRLMGNWAVSIHHLQRVSNGSYLQSTCFVTGQKA